MVLGPGSVGRARPSCSSATVDLNLAARQIVQHETQQLQHASPPAPNYIGFSGYAKVFRSGAGSGPWGFCNKARRVCLCRTQTVIAHVCQDGSCEAILDGIWSGPCES